MSICLHVIYGCFHTTTAELSSCDRNCMAHKLKMFIIWLFKKKFAMPCFLKSSSLMNIDAKRMLKDKMIINSYSKKHSIKSNTHNDFLKPWQT